MIIWPQQLFLSYSHIISLLSCLLIQNFDILPFVLFVNLSCPKTFFSICFLNLWSCRHLICQHISLLLFPSPSWETGPSFMPLGSSRKKIQLWTLRGVVNVEIHPARSFLHPRIPNQPFLCQKACDTCDNSSAIYNTVVLLSINTWSIPLPLLGQHSGQSNYLGWRPWTKWQRSGQSKLSWMLCCVSRTDHWRKIKDQSEYLRT